MELVFLIPMQEVVLQRTFLDSGFDCQPHGRDTNTVLTECGVKSGLVKVESRTVAQAVKRCGGNAVQMNQQKPQPASLGCRLHELPVKLDDGVGVKCFRLAPVS